MAGSTRTDRIAQHWRLLGLNPGAPECVIKAAHRLQIEIHHPDRGGDTDIAKQVNAAYDELRGRGSEANAYVASHYNAEPWVILGISSIADARLVERAGKQLGAELAQIPRLAERVRWATANFAKAVAEPSQGRRHAPITPPPPPRRRAAAPRRQPADVPARPGQPDGLPASIDFGTVRFGDSAATRTVQLTWRHAAPFEVSIDAGSPLRADVTSSKVLPGRFSVAISIDWDAPEFKREPTTRGFTIDVPVTIRWTSQDWTTVRAKGVVLYPAHVSASPDALDLGSVHRKQQTRASLVVVSTAPAELAIEPTPWLQRVDAAGRVLDAPLKLQTNVPIRIEFRVHWPPILERGAASFEAGRPVRATGRITLRWSDRETAVPVEMIVNAG